LFIEKVHNLFFSIYGCNYFMHFEIKMWKMLITWVLHFVNRKSYVLIRWMRPLYPNICKVHKKLEILLLYTFFFISTELLFNIIWLSSALFILDYRFLCYSSYLSLWFEWLVIIKQLC
jgi:hypothetical protein